MVNIPEKFYVARQRRPDDEILAYMVVADKEHTKAFQKAKEKADQWSFVHPSSWYADNGYKQLDPIYVDNKPRSGFCIVTNVSRYSTSNVVWRILHPEGFEFEITSDNMCDLMDTNTLSEGLILDKLFFTETRKLVNEKTKLFSSLVKKEEDKKALKVKSTELSPGTKIKVSVPHRYYSDDRSKDTIHELMYCGKFHTCGTNANRPMLVTIKSTARFVCFDLALNRYRTFNSLPEFEIMDNEVQEINSTEIINALNAQIRTNNYRVPLYYEDNYIPNESLPIFFSEKSYNYSDLKMQFETVSASKIESFNYNKIYNYSGHRIFAFYYENGPHTYKAECRSHYERPDNDLTLTGFLGEKIIEVLENGVPVIKTDIFSHKEIIGYNGPFDKHNPLVKIKLPETIEVGYYTLGE